MKKPTAVLFAILVQFCIAWQSVSAGEVTLNVNLDQTRMQAGNTSTAYVKVGLIGSGDIQATRPVLNLSLVLDRSGSMQGEKLNHAIDAAIKAVGMMGSQDYLSLVVYDSTVDVLIPATRVTEPEIFYRALNRLRSGGSTALFAGVSKGAQEVRKFYASNRVNRVILLSDGQANVGPDSPAALGELGSKLRREGISVTTIGLGDGYNEDLMSRLALTSDGNHAFAENPRDLTRIFESEFKDVLSVAALDIHITITCGPGVRPIRILNREGDIRGNTITINLNQILNMQEKYALIELEVPPGTSGTSRDIVSATATYRTLANVRSEIKQPMVRAEYTSDQALLQRSAQPDVKEQVVLQLATEKNEEALRLRDEGKTAEAQALLKQNSETLKAASAAYGGSSVLEEYAEANAMEADKITDDSEWNVQRKAMREKQYENRNQQSY